VSRHDDPFLHHVRKSQDCTLRVTLEELLHDVCVGDCKKKEPIGSVQL
jgi:hypothetical protein